MESGRGRVGSGSNLVVVDSVSSRAGSSRGLGRVGDGSGSYWCRLRVKPGRVGDGVWVESLTGRGRVGVDSVSSRPVSSRVGPGRGPSRGRVGVGVGSAPCQVGPGRDGICVESGTGLGRVGVRSVS